MKLNFNIAGIFSRNPKEYTAAVSFMRPEREWFIGIIIALLLLSCGAAYASFFFWYRVHSMDDSLVAQSGLVVYEEERVEETIRIYRERETKFNTLRGISLPDSNSSTPQQEESTLIMSEGSLGAE